MSKPGTVPLCCGKQQGILNIGRSHVSTLSRSTFWNSLQAVPGAALRGRHKSLSGLGTGGSSLVANPSCSLMKFLGRGLKRIAFLLDVSSVRKRSFKESPSVPGRGKRRLGSARAGAASVPSGNFNAQVLSRPKHQPLGLAVRPHRAFSGQCRPQVAFPSPS